jgi:hypothetical protein
MDFTPSLLRKQDIPEAGYSLYAWPCVRASEYLGEDCWQTIKALKFGVPEGVGNEDYKDVTITVPAGYIVLRQKLPWTLRWLAPIWGRHQTASILYQFMSEQSTAMVGGKLHRWTRREVHYSVLGTIGNDIRIPVWKRLVMTAHFAWLARKRYYDAAPTETRLFFEIEMEQNRAQKKAVSK